MLHPTHTASGPTMTYVYCLVSGRSLPSCSGSPRGLQDLQPLRLLDADPSLGLVVAGAPPDRYDEAAVQRGLQDLQWVSERAVDHESVVEFFCGRGTVIPMRMLTIFQSDERALEHVRSRRAELDRVFERIRGCREWGLRVRYLPQPESPSVDEASEARVSESGAEFLRRKKERWVAAREQPERARVRALEIFEHLQQGARESMRQDTDRGGGREILQAAFLVPEREERDFRRSAERAAAHAAADACEVVLSGPWPAYNFVGETRDGG